MKTATLLYIIGGVVVALGCYAIYRRSRRTVVSFDSLLKYAESSKNSGAAAVVAFRLSSMPEAQRRQTKEQMGLGRSYKMNGYKDDATLIVAQVDENDNVLAQRAYYGHSFDERLSAAFSTQSMLKITLK